MHEVDLDKPRIIWQPLPGSQTLALSCPAHIILYHGSRGPGKTDSQLMRFRMRVGQGFGKHWRGIIFDREYKNLDDLVAKSMRWFPEFHDGAKFLASKSDYRWVWPTGEQLMFRAIKKDTDYWSYHGQEFPFIGWNELTKYPDSNLFESMLSCNRSSYRPEDHPIYETDDNGTTTVHYTPPLPLEVFATCNPHGVGHNWVKKQFINKSPMGAVHRTVTRVFNPQLQKDDDVVRTQVHLFGSYRENKYLPPEYIALLENITDKNKRRAWLYGDWDIIAGGMFDDKWDTLHHVIKPFQIPPTWRIERTFDWGSSKPFSVGWWAVSNGDPFVRDGKTIRTIKNDSFRIAEWYGCDPEKSNTGLKLLNTQISEGIIKREIAMGIHHRVRPGAADGAIYDVNDGNSIAASMEKNVTIAGKTYRGATFVPADKSPGSRISGWDMMREMLDNALPYNTEHDSGIQTPRTREKPGMFVFNNCTNFIDLVPILPRDETNMDDVDTDAEDHIGDESRYFTLSLNIGGRTGKTVGAG